MIKLTKIPTFLKELYIRNTQVSVKREAVNYEFDIDKYSNRIIEKVWREFKEAFQINDISNGLIGYYEEKKNKIESLQFNNIDSLSNFIKTDFNLHYIEIYLNLRMHWFDQKTGTLGKSIFPNCASFHLWLRTNIEDKIWMNFEIFPNLFTDIIQYNDKTPGINQINIGPAAELNRKWLKNGLEQFQEKTFSNINQYSSQDIILFNEDKIPYFLCKNENEFKLNDFSC